MSKFVSVVPGKAARLLMAGSAAGALALCAPPTFAQDAAAPVAPIVAAPVAPAILAAPGNDAAPPELQDAPLPNAPIADAPMTETPRNTATRLPVPTRISMEWQDANVSDIIYTIASTFNLPIVILQDVQGSLRAFKLNEATPEEAIKKVAMYGGLKFRKEEDGTLVIGKVLPNGLSANDASERNSLPTQIMPWVAPQNGLDTTNYGGTTAITGGAMPAAGFSLPNSSNNYDFLGNGLLSTPRKEDDARAKSRYLKVRNVRPGLLAWWLGSRSNDFPIELASTVQANEDLLNKKYKATPALSPRDQMLRAGIFNGVGAANPYLNSNVNPYLPSANVLGGAPTYSQPGTQTFANSQLGGGGNTGRQGGLGNNGGGGGGVFQLPEGIDQVVAIDPQNALLVRGTEEGLAELEELIAFLDQPLRQVEIEAQFIDVSTDALKDFGIDFSSFNGPFTASGSGLAPAPSPATAGSFTLGYVRNNFQATLTALVRNNRAKVVNAPRVTAINNLTAELTVDTSTPVVLTDSIGGIGGQVGQSQQLFYITTSIGLTVTPTINNDDTITVLMQPQVELQSPPPPGVSAPSTSSQSVRTVANVRDGDTIALGGLRTKTITVSKRRIPIFSHIPFIGKLFQRSTDIEAERELIIFLTARIVRRADDVVPGT